MRLYHLINPYWHHNITCNENASGVCSVLQTTVRTFTSSPKIIKSEGRRVVFRNVDHKLLVFLIIYNNLAFLTTSAHCFLVIAVAVLNIVVGVVVVVVVICATVLASVDICVVVCVIIAVIVAANIVFPAIGGVVAIVVSVTVVARVIIVLGERRLHDFGFSFSS